MKTLVFATNFKCSGCIEKVTPFLNAVAGEGNWKADITAPGKLLTVQGDKMNSQDVTEAVQKAGFKASLITEQ